VGHGVSRTVVGAVDVGAGHPGEDVGFELPDGASRRDPRIVDQDVDASEVRDRCGYDALRGFESDHGIGVGNGAAPRGDDLPRQRLGRSGVLPRATRGGADVVHHHARAQPGQQAGRGASDAAAGAGHDRHLPLEAKAHGVSHAGDSGAAGTTSWRFLERSVSYAARTRVHAASRARKLARLPGRIRECSPQWLPARWGEGE
jgi:hypothetical protein